MENKSTHQCLVYEMKLEKHPQADKLSIMSCEGYNICVNTEQWQGIKLGAFCQPDSIVDLSKPEFSFLDDKNGKTHYRVRCKKLRGIVSYGFMIPVDHLNVNVGDDLADILGIQHYEPEATLDFGGMNLKTPANYGKYDVDSFLKYHKLFIDGESIRISEKIHGQNMRIVFSEGEIKIGSRSFWKKETDDSPFWKSFREDERLEKFIKDNPDIIVFGEQYGHNKGMKYGCENGKVKFAAFDIRRKDHTYIDGSELDDISNKIPFVPTIYKGPYEFELVKTFCEGKTLISNDHYREGVVITCDPERSNDKYGRMKYKLINPTYLEKH